MARSNYKELEKNALELMNRGTQIRSMAQGERTGGIGKSVTELVGRGLSTPARRHYKRKGDVADEYRKAVRLARETRKVHANPADAEGRRILSARQSAEDAKRFTQGKRTLFPKPKKGTY